MVDNNSENLIAKLKTLSKRELDVLWLRCKGMKYMDIGKALHIAVPTVKTNMGRVYMKLGLDVLEPSARMKAIYDTFAPLLEQLQSEGKKENETGPVVIEGEVVEDEPKTVPRRIWLMVENDEKAIVPVPPGTLVAPARPPRGPNRLLVLVVGVVLGICLGAGGVYFVMHSLNGPIPLISQPTPTVSTSTLSIPTAVPSDTSLPSPTQGIPAQTPVVIVITATPAPATEVPSLTPLPQPTTLFADNFDQGLSKSWSVVSGNPVVVNGQLTSDQDTWLRIGDNSWTDYTVQLDVVAADCWFSWSWSAIAVRVKDKDNLIAFKFASCESEWDIVKNGNWTPVPNSHGQGTSANTPSTTITVTVQGGQFAVDINGTRVSSFFNSDYMQGGIAIKVGPKTQIDNLKITAIGK